MADNNYKNTLAQMRSMNVETAFNISKLEEYIHLFTAGQLNQLRQLLENQFEGDVTRMGPEFLDLLADYQDNMKRGETLLTNAEKNIQKREQAFALLHFFVPVDLQEAILGDLTESYRKQVSKLGFKTAQLWLWKEVVFCIGNFAVDYIVTKFAKLNRLSK